MKCAGTLVLALVVALAVPSRAQKQVGETSLSLTGDLAGGYSADYSNYANSDHSFGGSGLATLSGSYFNPNFLSFMVEPYYDQSRVNSNSQSITASSGVSASASIFSGSHFPGSVSYSKNFDSSGTYGIPGTVNYTTHGDNSLFGVTWGLLFDGWPTLNVSFSDGSSSYSVFGTDSEGSSSYKTLNLNSAYTLKGFNLNGGYQYTTSGSEIPDILVTEEGQGTNTSSTVSSVYFGVGHRLPLHGGFSATLNRSSLDASAGSGENYNSTIDSYGAHANFNPIKNLSVGTGVYYLDDLFGSLYNSLVSNGVILPVAETQSSSSTLNVDAYATYDLQALHLRAGYLRMDQGYGGKAYVSNAYNAAGTYSHPLLGGFFTGTLGVTRTSSNTSNQSWLGLNTSVNYTHRVGRWSMGGTFAYTQAAQTIIVVYTSSGYSYSGSIGRKIRRRMYWNVAASGEQSLLTNQPGTSNSGQSYSTSFSFPHLSISGSYAKSNGNGLVTTAGIIASPIPIPIIPSTEVVFFNGESYSAGIGTSPVRGLTISASFSKALSNTASVTSSSKNNNENANIYLVYHLRKLDITAGYNKLNQGFSLSGLPPQMVGSYYFGVSRWFHFF